MELSNKRELIWNIQLTDNEMGAIVNALQKVCDIKDITTFLGGPTMTSDVSILLDFINKFNHAPEVK